MHITNSSTLKLRLRFPFFIKSPNQNTQFFKICDPRPFEKCPLVPDKNGNLLWLDIPRKWGSVSLLRILGPPHCLRYFHLPVLSDIEMTWNPHSLTSLTLLVTCFLFILSTAIHYFIFKMDAFFNIMWFIIKILKSEKIRTCCCEPKQAGISHSTLPTDKSLIMWKWHEKDSCQFNMSSPCSNITRSSCHGYLILHTSNKPSSATYEHKE